MRRRRTFGKFPGEAGGARVHESHAALLHLVRMYDLETVDVGALPPVSEGPRRRVCALRTTVHHLLPKTEDVLTLQREIGYDAEFEVAHAREAQKSVCHDLTQPNYKVLKAGTSNLAQTILRDAVRQGCNARLRAEVVSIERGSTKFVLQVRGDAEALEVDRAVLALPASAAQRLQPSLRLGRYLAPSSLMRIYASWAAPWWSGMKKQVVGGRIGIFIPIDDRVVMASYTDTGRADDWQALDDAATKALLWRSLVDAFPDRQIPAPEAVYRHYWPEGVHCFCPRRDPVPDSVLVRRWREPLPRLHLAGEAFSMQHQWIEGAVDSALRVVLRILRDQPSSRRLRAPP